MSFTGYFIRYSKILSHVVGWFLLLLLPFVLFSLSSGKQSFLPAYSATYGWLWVYFVSSALWIAFLYFNAAFLTPKFALSQNIRPYFLLQIIFVIIAFLITPLLFLSFSEDEGFNGWSLQNACTLCVCPYLLILAGSTAYQLVKSNRLVMEARLLGHKPAQAAGNGQASPAFNLQFLHNALNSIIQSSAARQQNPPAASLIKLSSLQHYYLYGQAKPRIGLDEELQQLNNYVDLQQQVFRKNVTVLIKQKIEQNKYAIKPMLLIPFVEDALNASPAADNLLIEVSLNEKKNMLRLVVKDIFDNTVPNAGEGSLDVGLKGVKRRLVINCFAI